MGLIRDYFNNRKIRKENKRLDKLERDLSMILNRNDYVFNPTKYRSTRLLTPEQEFTLSVIENKSWFTGEPKQIRNFYLKNPEQSGDLNLFWRTAPVNYRKVHSGIPGLISTKFPTILFGGGVDFDISVDDDSLSDKQQELLNKDILNYVETLKKKIDFNKKIEDGATVESYSGHLFYKLGYDIEISDYPILELLTVENAEVVKVRGITTEIIFNDYYNFENETYIHKEIYSTTENNDAVLYNKLYRIKKHSTNNKPEEVALTSLEATQELEEELIFKGVKGLLAFEKPNKLPNRTFINSNFGASDYEGSISAFDGLDEILSEIATEVRNNKTKRYVPTNMLRYITNQATGEITVGDIDPFVTNYVKIDSDPDQNAKNEIYISDIKDKQESLQSKWRIFLTTVINNAGLSPVALGITGLESIDASAESQQERNKATLETRARKQKLWKPFLEEIISQLLKLNQWMRVYKASDLNELDDGFDKIKHLDFEKVRPQVRFGDYIVETQLDKINKWGTAKQFGLAQTRTGLYDIWEDWSEAQIDNELNGIRYEQGMALENPMNLPDLTGFDDDEVDEINKELKIEDLEKKPPDKS